VIWIATKIVSLGPTKKFRQNPFTSLRVIRRTDRQTDRQTDRTKNITSFFGGGNKYITDDNTITKNAALHGSLNARQLITGTIAYPAYPGCPGDKIHRAVKRLCVCVCVWARSAKSRGASFDGVDEDTEAVVLDRLSAGVHHRRLVLADCMTRTQHGPDNHFNSVMSLVLL